MTKKPSLLILELTSETREDKSEGWLLWELMRILELKSYVRFEKVRGKSDFLNLLDSARENYIHIAAHGVRHRGRTSLLTPKEAKIFPEELKGLWATRRRKPELIVLSACYAGHADLIKPLSDAGCRYIIAPLNETYWDDAALFSTIFYKILLSEGKSPWISYKRAILGVKAAFSNLSGAWRFYKKGRPIFIE